MRRCDGHYMATGVAVLLLCLTGCAPEPDEARVRELFEAGRPALERILEMSNQDYAQTKVTRIAPDFTRLEHNWGWPRPEGKLGISVSRWNEYRKLFEEAGLTHGIDRAGDVSDGVYFPVWAEGIADNSREKGVMFSPTPPSDLRGGSQRINYKRLADNWYYYEWTTW